MLEVWRILEETRLLEMELLYHQSDRLYQELLEQDLARAKEEEGEDSVASRIIEFPL